MALDEVTQICPVPVPSWLADSGGKGIQIITVAHGEAQLRGRWGADGARVIMDTSGAKIWLPGISDPATLEPPPPLCGTTAMKETRDLASARTTTGTTCYARHPVMTPEMIRQLPGRYALLHPRRHVPGHRPPAHGLERPRLQARPPRRPRHRRPHRRRARPGSGTRSRVPREPWPRSTTPPPAPSRRPSEWDDPDRYPWQ